MHTYSASDTKKNCHKFQLRSEIGYKICWLLEQKKRWGEALFLKAMSFKSFNEIQDLNILTDDIQSWCVNLQWPSDVNMASGIWWTLLLLMAWCLLGSKPLPESILIHCQLDSLVKFQINHEWKKMNLKVLSAKWQPFLSSALCIKWCKWDILLP